MGDGVSSRGYSSRLVIPEYLYVQFEQLRKRRRPRRAVQSLCKSEIVAEDFQHSARLSPTPTVVVEGFLSHVSIGRRQHVDGRWQVFGLRRRDVKSPMAAR